MSFGGGREGNADQLHEVLKGRGRLKRRTWRRRATGGGNSTTVTTAAPRLEDGAGDSKRSGSGGRGTRIGTDTGTGGQDRSSQDTETGAVDAASQRERAKPTWAVFTPRPP